MSASSSLVDAARRNGAHALLGERLSAEAPWQSPVAAISNLASVCTPPEQMSVVVDRMVATPEQRGQSLRQAIMQMVAAVAGKILSRPFTSLSFLACVAMLRRLLSARTRALSAAAVAALVGRACRGHRLAASAVASVGSAKDKDKTKQRGEQVCVVGGGIAGCGAAWALHRSGFEVTLLEKRPTLGGNMKAHTWNVGDQKVRTGLAVLAWPAQLFHNYGALIKALEVKIKPHVLKWFITRRLAGREQNDVEFVYAHGPGENGAKTLQQPWLAADLAAWTRCVNFIRRTNAFFQPAPIEGVMCAYRNSLLNPMNIIGLRTLSRVFGVSSRFWDEVYVAIHASSLLETKMDGLPAVIAEILEDIVPIADPMAPPEMDSWLAGHGDEVFDRLTSGFQERVFTSAGIESLRIEMESGKQRVIVTDDGGQVRSFDRVIFACGAPAALRALPATCPCSGVGEKATYWALKTVLANCKYVEDRDLTYERGIIHSDADRGLPSDFKQDILDGFGTYCETQYAPSGEVNYENVFVVSSWLPKMQEPGLKGKRPMMISWNCANRLKDLDDDHYERDVVMREAHPQLSTTNMFFSMFMWGKLQGACNGSLYFCGSAITPGNGHDLSLLSGFVVARHLGADYPFPDNKSACADFKKMQEMMGLTTP